MSQFQPAEAPGKANDLPDCMFSPLLQQAHWSRRCSLFIRLVTCCECSDTVCLTRTHAQVCCGTCPANGSLAARLLQHMQGKAAAVRHSTTWSASNAFVSSQDSPADLSRNLQVCHRQHANSSQPGLIRLPGLLHDTLALHLCLT